MTAETTILETTTSTGKRVRHLFTRQEQTPRGLVVILPGRGYLLEHPLLHYLRKLAGELNYDVLGVRYGYQMTAGDTGDLMSFDILTGEIERAISAVLAQRDYARVFLAGKSLGTALAVRQGERLKEGRLKDADLRYILLTPVADSTQNIGVYPTLAVIGTADSAYDAARVRADDVNPHLHWHVFDGLNHGLEFAEGWDASIAVLGQIMAHCEAFLKAE